jgi:Fe-S cluster assembly protein SufD
MPAVLEHTNVYESEFRALAGRVGSLQPGWLRAIREAAFDRFREVGFPTLDDEDWRFTNVDPIAKAVFRVPASPAGRIARDRIEPYLFPVRKSPVLVFVDGWFVPDLSVVEASAETLRVLDLASALKTHPDVLHPFLGRFADPERDPFTALNSAFMENGAYVRIGKGAVLEEPIQLLFISSAGSKDTKTHPRNLIVAEENSQAAVVEHYVALGDDAYFTNAISEVVAGESSVLEHYMIVRDSVNAFNVSTLRVEQMRDSNFTSHTVLAGGGLVRNNVHPVLNGEGCQSLLNGLYIVNGTQHMDNFMLVEHAKPHGDSRQFYKGILDDEGKAVFSGRIIVHKNAQKTDAKQTNMNLLLSDKAQIDTKPQLEIYADDVKCTHGATIGQIDADAVFYLRSRGLSEEAAKSLLTFAFAAESLERMKCEPVRKALEAVVHGRLPHARLREGLP